MALPVVMNLLRPCKALSTRHTSAIAGCAFLLLNGCLMASMLQPSASGLTMVMITVLNTLGRVQLLRDCVESRGGFPKSFVLLRGLRVFKCSGVQEFALRPCVGASRLQVLLQARPRPPCPWLASVCLKSALASDLASP